MQPFRALARQFASAPRPSQPNRTSPRDRHSTLPQQRTQIHLAQINAFTFSALSFPLMGWNRKCICITRVFLPIIFHIVTFIMFVHRTWLDFYAGPTGSLSWYSLGTFWGMFYWAHRDFIEESVLLVIRLMGSYIKVILSKFPYRGTCYARPTFFFLS